jgi:hypothetical protein
MIKINLGVTVYENMDWIRMTHATVAVSRAHCTESSISMNGGDTDVFRFTSKISLMTIDFDQAYHCFIFILYFEVMLCVKIKLRLQILATLVTA